MQWLSEFVIAYYRILQADQNQEADCALPGKRTEALRNHVIICGAGTANKGLSERG